MLNNVELEYAFICNQGYSNREIADMKNISEKTVSRIFTEIYDKLGISSRKELIDIVNATHG